jgi:hypothetical protein
MKFSSIGFIGSQGLDVDFLLVGGGSIGENSNQTDYGGYGGGAGGFNASQTSVALGKAYPIVVGLGGTNVVPNGGSSSFADFYAGGGIGNQNGYPQLNGNVSPQTISCSGRTYKQGGAGSSITGSLPYCISGTDGKAGDGGSGSLWYDGNYYAGGGGSATLSGVIGNTGVGGTGGGGIGGYNNAGPVTGSKNTGGGGGGGSAFGTGQGADGGSGIVKIRYYGTGSKATGGTITYSGGYTYHSFTASATFTTT